MKICVEFNAHQTKLLSRTQDAMKTYENLYYSQRDIPAGNPWEKRSRETNPG